jgi:hypothetical protein
VVGLEAADADDAGKLDVELGRLPRRETLAEGVFHITRDYHLLAA